MKKILLVVLTAVVCSGAFAQKDDDKRLHFSVGAELGVITGDFQKFNSLGVGGTAQVEYNVASGTNLTLTGGFISYIGKSAGTNTKYKALGILPIRAGIKYAIIDNFYGAAQLGAGIISNGGGTAFAYSPIIGYEFTMNSGKTIDASLKYDGYSKANANFGAVGIRLAYKF
jgi:hypothetical protein